METVTLVPLRKNCPSLPGTMAGIVMSIGGVEHVEVIYDTRSLVISYDPEKVTPETLIKKIGEETGLGMRIGGVDESNSS